MHSKTLRHSARLLKSVPAGALAALAVTAAHADVVYTEGADAGELLATAQPVLVVGTVEAIRGSTGTGDRADLFAVYLTAGTAFSASTEDSSIAWNNFDTVLYLFSAVGTELAVNDDDIGSQSLLSYLPTLSGLYYLGITGASYEPTFTDDALSGWASLTNEFGAYEIRLEGAMGIPEPASLLLAGIALAAAGAVRRRVTR
jgi:hypothetical protein